MIDFHARGNPAYMDEHGRTFYADGTPIPDDPTLERPCTQCGKCPTPEGYDACLGHIDGAKAACCGHGIDTGYIAWEVGKGVIRREYAITIGRWRIALVLDREVEGEGVAVSDTRW